VVTAPAAVAKLSLAGKPKISATGVRLTLSCSGAPCRGAAKLAVKRNGKRVALGSARFTIATGAHKTITIKLTSAARRLLGRAHTLRATLRITLAGSTTTLTRHVTIRRRH
jgi:hypothetical protein